MRSARIFLTFIAALFVAVSYAQQCEHVVQRGEDFDYIANKYNITVDELKQANPKVKKCYAGHKLIIPSHGVSVEQKALVVESSMPELTSSDAKVLTTTAASSYQVGLNIWKQGNYESAIDYLSDAANNGETRAYYPLAECYSKDSTSFYDPAKAFENYKNAVKSTTSKSDESYWMSCLGLSALYIKGTGTEKDVKQARYYYNEYKRHATKSDNSVAQQILRSITAEEKSAVKSTKSKKTIRTRTAKTISSVSKKQNGTKAARQRSDDSFTIKQVDNDVYAESNAKTSIGNGATTYFALAKTTDIPRPMFVLYINDPNNSLKLKDLSEEDNILVNFMLASGESISEDCQAKVNGNIIAFFVAPYATNSFYNTLALSKSNISSLSIVKINQDMSQQTLASDLNVNYRTTIASKMQTAIENKTGNNFDSEYSFTAEQ